MNSNSNSKKNVFINREKKSKDKQFFIRQFDKCENKF